MAAEALEAHFFEFSHGSVAAETLKLEFSRGSVAAEAIEEVATEALIFFPRKPTGRSEAFWAPK